MLRHRNEKRRKRVSSRKSFYHMSKMHAKQCTWQTKCFKYVFFWLQAHTFDWAHTEVLIIAARASAWLQGEQRAVTLPSHSSTEDISTRVVYLFSRVSWQLALGIMTTNVLMCYSTLVIYCDLDRILSERARADIVSFVSIACLFSPRYIII